MSDLVLLPEDAALEWCVVRTAWHYEARMWVYECEPMAGMRAALRMINAMQDGQLFHRGKPYIPSSWWRRMHVKHKAAYGKELPF